MKRYGRFLGAIVWAHLTTFICVTILMLIPVAVAGCRNLPDDPTPTATTGILPVPIASVTPTESPTSRPTPTGSAPGNSATPASPLPSVTATEPPLDVQTPSPTDLAPGPLLFLPLVQRPAAEEIAAAIPDRTTIVGTDFDAVRSELQRAGKELAYIKIGFHVTLLLDDDLELLMGQLQLLDKAGVPFFLKSASNAEPLYLAQEMMKASGVPHTLVYRSTTWDVPDYHLSPELAAERHWQRHRDAFPPELDPNLVWIETLNEVDRNLSEWLARFSLKTAELTMRDGFRWAAFGWASGEPEPEAWRSAPMLEFLRLVGENPDRLAIALHEYSFLTDDIAHLYPFKVGRFLDLFRAADENGFPRPTVLITEWGWAYDDAPNVERAMADVRWASALYAPFPQIKGAAIWNFGRLGRSSDELSELIEPLVIPLTEYGLTHYFALDEFPDQASTESETYRP